MPKKIVCSTTTKHPKFAPLTLDFTFKREFATEQNKNLLLLLLNSFLEEVLKNPITDVRMLPTVQLAETIESRGAVFDVLCEDSSGNRFIVEMQVAHQRHFIKRAFFYLSLAVASVAKKGMQECNGKKIPYDFNYPIVYSLNFMNFDLDFGKGCDEVVQYISMHNRRHPEINYDLGHIVFVRLAKFNKTELQCKSDIDRFLFSFKNADKLDEAPASFTQAEFKQLFEVAKISNFNQEEYMRYTKQITTFSDHQSALEYAEEKGVIKTAKAMKAGGETISKIMRYTGLPREQIMALR